ncbi:MAG TPA: RluA family pseudouridine synthase [Parasegetibacter sp.]
MTEDLEIFNDNNEAEAEESQDILYERQVIRTNKGQEPYRIDKFLMNRVEGATRNKVQQAIEAGRVLVNGKQVKSNYKVRPLDEITIYSHHESAGEQIIPEEVPFNIAYEDEEVLIIDKTPGLVVHPGSGNPSGTLINGVAWYLLKQNAELSEETLPRYGMVHRIDKNTSGLMVIGKTARAVSSLAKQFFDHTIDRKYIALVWGDVEQDSGTIVAHVGRHQRFRKLFEAYPDGEHGKEAITHYKVLERFGYVTLVECQLETGRTHQIRVHMKHIGHPLFNDELYGGDRIVKGTVFSKYKQFVDNCFAICPRHALHAQILGFDHPATRKRVVFESPLPADMEGVKSKWRGYIQSRLKTE